MKESDTVKLVEEILSTINSAKTTQEILDNLVDRIIKITDSLTGSIMLIDHEAGVLDIKASRGLKTAAVASTKLKVGEGVTGFVARKGESLLVNDVRSVPYYVRIRDDLKSELAVPIKDKNSIIGVMSVDSDRLNAYTKEDLGLLETIASFAAQTLIKANLIEDLKHRIDDQELLIAIGGILEEEIDFNSMFQKIMTAMSGHMRIKRGMISVLDDGEKLRVRTGYHLSDEAIERGVYDVGEGTVGKVFHTGKSIAIRDVSESTDFLNKMKIRRGKSETCSFFAVPLKYDSPVGSMDKTIGVLGIEKEYRSDTDHRSTLRLLTIIASLIANRLYRHISAQREKEKLLKQNTDLREKLMGRGESVFIGKSKAIVGILNTATIVADTDATVLITGETGTGKEVLARFVHEKSRRAEKPFIGINCAAIPENLLESELFGYKKGAFTGAVADKKGKFLLAHEGTIFLDEIGELPLPLQSKILRVLQERVIEPVGGEESRSVDVRIIAATNRDLKAYVDEKKFRDDLYYRLHVIHIPIPSLSERTDDIPLFVEHFIEKFNAKYGKEIRGLTPECREAFLSYRWPGNVRELENVIERAVILSHSDSIDISAVPKSLAPHADSADADDLEKAVLAAVAALPPGTVYQGVTDMLDRIVLTHALVASDNKQTEAAKLLGLHRNTLREKLRSLSGRS
ncbi:MAG: sigma 54-interacting transcriptional regulator [Spirochaetota bacterium]